MRHRKKRSRFGLLSRIVGLLVVFSATHLWAADYKIRFAINQPPDNPWTKGGMVFKKYVEELSKGRIAVEVHHSGTMGKQREVVEMVRMGTLEMTMPGAAQLQAFAPEMGAVVIPYIWKDRETMFETLDGPLGDYFLAKNLDKAGIRFAGFVDNGFRSVTNSKRPIKSVEDMKGLKIRVLPSPICLAYFKAIGASPIHVDWVELFEALRSGVVDAQENPPTMVLTARFPEIQKYYSLTGHMNEPGVVIMSKQFYSKLPEDLKLVVDLAGRNSVLWERQEMDEENRRALKKLEEAGMKVNTLSDAAIAEFRKVAQEQVFPEVVKTKGCGPKTKELIDLLVWANK